MRREYNKALGSCQKFLPHLWFQPEDTFHSRPEFLDVGNWIAWMADVIGAVHQLSEV